MKEKGEEEAEETDGLGAVGICTASRQACHDRREAWPAGFRPRGSSQGQGDPNVTPATRTANERPSYPPG